MLKLPDQRLVYSANGTWWDSIDKAGRTPPGASGISLPCCPVCGSVLFEMESEEPWWEGARKYEAAGHPGYVDMITWGRGKCFPNLAALEAAYANRSDQSPSTSPANSAPRTAAPTPTNGKASHLSSVTP